MCEIFGIKINDLSLAKAIQKIEELVQLKQKNLIVTANPEILLKAYKNSEFKNKIKQAKIILVDGIGVMMVCKLLGQTINQGRVTGVDLVEELAKQSQISDFSLFFVGEDEVILQKATQNLKIKYPNAKILGYSVGPVFSENQKMPILDQTNNELIKKINYLKPDILLVGFGSPKQDNWLNYYLPLVDCFVGIGVGGTFDYLSGQTERAPIFWRKLGFEWLYRVIKQPFRFKRIINAVVLFPLLAIFYRFKHKCST